jgi:CubicO group peptidase (beta-lactamase class C family)
MTAVDPRTLGFDPDRLGAALRALELDVEAQRCDGGTLVVGRRGRTALFETRGYADRQRSLPLEPDHVFVSMSIGKQFTNALVLNRVERGELRLHAPIAELLPEFRARGKDRITLFHLLTHTSGLPSQVPQLAPDELIDVARLTAFAAGAPLESLPGARVTYSILVAHAVLGCLLRRTDGTKRSLAQLMREDLFGPLGMEHTSLGPRADLVERLCPVVARYKEPGLFVPEELEGIAELVLREGAEIPAGGFLTTAGDVHRFAEMLRRGGELDGFRLLSPAILELATRNHTGERPNSLMDYTVSMRGWDPWPAYIGLGFFVRGEAVVPGPIGSLASPRSFGGWGAGSTCFWVDPQRDLSFSFLSTGLMEDSRHIERVSRLSDLVLAAVVD